jgi:hypothetical protein
MSRALLTIGLLGLCSAPAGAQGTKFSWDLSGGASQSALGDLQDTDRSVLAATYYFDPVDDSQAPYSLAAFLDPASRVSASVNHEKRTSHLIRLFVPPPPAVVSDSSVTTDDFTIGGRYVLAESKWYVGGDYTKVTNDPLATFYDRFDSKSYRALAGKYFGPNTTLELSLNRSEQEFGRLSNFCSPSVCPAGPIDIETKATTEDIDLRFEHVRRFRSLTYSLFGGVSQANGHSTTVLGPFGRSEFELARRWTYSFGAEAFPTRKVGIGVGYTRSDGDPGRGESYDVTASWFFKRNIGIQGGWSQARTESNALPGSGIPANPRADTTDVRFIGRF